VPGSEIRFTWSRPTLAGLMPVGRLVASERWGSSPNSGHSVKVVPAVGAAAAERVESGTGPVSADPEPQALINSAAVSSKVPSARMHIAPFYRTDRLAWYGRGARQRETGQSRARAPGVKQ
jgi:hypothetical protein